MRYKRQQEFASFGKILKGLLQRKGMSQSQLAEVLGVQRQAVSYYVIGQKLPDYDNLLKIAEYFDVSIDYLLRGEYKDIHTITGLSSEAVENLKVIKRSEIKKYNGSYATIDFFNKLVSDKGFPHFIVDLQFWAEQVIDYEGKLEPIKDYYNWLMQTTLLNFFQDFLWRLIDSERDRIEKEIAPIVDAIANEVKKIREEEK